MLISKLIGKCEKVLIEKPVETIWAEFQNLLEDDKIDGIVLVKRSHSLLQISHECTTCCRGLLEV